MPATGTQLIDRTRRFMGDYPDLDTVNGSVSSTGTTLTVDGYDGYAVNTILQVGTEALRIDAVGSSTSLTVTRGVLGTTAASIADNATVLVRPRFIDLEYLDALNYGIQSTWPWIYRPVIDDSSITIATDTYEYTIPEHFVRNELSEANSRFESSVGDWATSGTNTVAVAQAGMDGGQAMKVTFQDNANLAELAITARIATPHVASAWAYVPSDYDGTGIAWRSWGWGNDNDHATVFLDMSKTNQWQYTEFVVTPIPSDLVGKIAFQGRDVNLNAANPTAGKFFYVDNVSFGVRRKQMRHVSRLEVKPPGCDEWYERRRWSTRRGGLQRESAGSSLGNQTNPGLRSQQAGSSLIVFKNLETANTQVRLSGFGPFPGLVNTTDVLDPDFPPEAVHPLVEFAASHLMESGEARRVAQDRGLADQREQANRVGASMQASQALLNRFERRLQMIGMPPPNGYPHVQPWP